MKRLAIGMWCFGLSCMLGSAVAAEQLAGIDPRDLPCVRNGPELADATAKLDALDKQIHALKPADSVVAANDALIALTRHECMRLSRIEEDQLRAEAAPALVYFWDNGGKSWIQSQLRLASGRSLEYPPVMRKVVSVETRPDHPALSLLCPLADQACGRETSGWWQRASDYLQLVAAPIARINRNAPYTMPDPQLTQQDCKDESAAVPAAERFAVWERCVTETRDYGFAMPLGHVRAPTKGWLVVRGRRGHYTYCDEVRMYSLATGAAYISQSCSLLMLLIAGDGTPTRNRQVVRGSVPLDNIREVAWMLLLQGDTAEGYTRLDQFSIPMGIDPVRGPENPFLSGRPQMSGMVSSSQTTLAWTLIGDAGRSLLSGKLMWPNDYVPGPSNHAVRLLQVAEGGFIAGCPAEMPPRDIDFGASKPVVSALDANPAELSRAERDLLTDLYQAARADCAAPR